MYSFDSRLSEATTAAVCELKDTTAQTEVRSFLGLCNLFRLFVPNFSKVAATLNKKLPNYQWTTLSSLTKARKNAVENLKTILINPPVLTSATQNRSVYG